MGSSTAVASSSRTPYFSLASVPQELTEHILKFCHPRDFASLSETCTTLRNIVYNEDDYIWRMAFLMYPFDDMRLSLDVEAVGGSAAKGSELKDKMKTKLNWRKELQRRVFAEGVLRRPSEDAKLDGRKLLKAIEILNDAVDSAAPAASSFISASSRPDDTDISYNLAWAEDTLLHSKVFEAPPASVMEMIDSDPIVEEKLERLRSRLRCYLSLAHETGIARDSEERLRRLRIAARCFVYDLGHYCDQTRWGPYKLLSRPSNQVLSAASGDGKYANEVNKEPVLVVNWEHVEHVRNVVYMNLRELPGYWRSSVVPTFDIQATRPWSAPGYLSETRNPRDWAGVEGVWRRVVCFMDYRDLFSFNYTSMQEMRLHPTYFDGDFSEATRVVEAQFVFDEEASLATELEEDDDPSYPPVAFSGLARGVHLTRQSHVRGTIRKKKDYIRWSFITTHDRSQWAAEGVQVGGVGSAMGVAGIWTVAVHEEEGDPAGPFWMWKADQSLPENMLVLHDS
ncbi:hypothetical protein BDY19DRAFT_996579 [Irpex rosettiformis]|uniref:Uncharacterized protein n=1 Tax=Irpex rosettiformis TaxID=378272 RepID=A0ACB8TUD3_9APHY|nr:hypothetical protein BDY19DRAFT_996579 [Irpex rosettiformis]